jgi:hypothetical protein
MAVMLLLVSAACQKPGMPSKAQTASSKTSQAEKPVKQSEVQTAPSQKAQPQQFGFRVVSVQKELCCSDTPGKPVPTGGVAVEGLSNDDWRFVLSCADTFRVVKTASGYKTKSATKDEWYELHTASVERKDYGDVMTIYIFEGQPIDWVEFARCSIEGRIDRAKDVVSIRVISSEAREWKNGSGFEVEALSANESYRLACVQGAQSPCVSVAPAIYRGVRDGSELRLCDQELKLISTYGIKAERGHP